MSFNRLDYDTCAYKQELSESIGVGEYQLGTPHFMPRLFLTRSAINFTACRSKCSQKCSND